MSPANADVLEYGEFPNSGSVGLSGSTCQYRLPAPGQQVGEAVRERPEVAAAERRGEGRDVAEHAARPLGKGLRERSGTCEPRDPGVLRRAGPGHAATPGHTVREMTTARHGPGASDAKPIRPSIVMSMEYLIMEAS